MTSKDLMLEFWNSITNFVPRALAKENLNLKKNYIVYVSVLFTKDEPKLMELIKSQEVWVEEYNKNEFQISKGI